MKLFTKFALVLGTGLILTNSCVASASDLESGLRYRGPSTSQNPQVVYEDEVRPRQKSSSCTPKAACGTAVALVAATPVLTVALITAISYVHPTGELAWVSNYVGGPVRLTMALFDTAKLAIRTYLDPDSPSALIAKYGGGAYATVINLYAAHGGNQ